MRDGNIDYSRYTLRELEEALAGINPHRFPKNHANLQTAYEALKSARPSVPQADAPAAMDRRAGLQAGTPWPLRAAHGGRGVLRVFQRDPPMGSAGASPSQGLVARTHHTRAPA